ncbi:MAG: metallopeptidase family protein [Actinomycetia bacterium]|nr:metallopeptidase family protein [Actinomycetes bacterium]
MGGSGDRAASEQSEPDFEAVVDYAMKGLPPELAAAISNVDIVIEDQHDDDPDVYGLYWGVPLTERTSGYAGVLPDKISLYRGPLMRDFGHDLELLEEEIRVTVLHELAHHFGIDDARLDELGYA